MIQPTRPSESDMITKPRADAMQRQLDAAIQETEQLRVENAKLAHLLQLWISDADEGRIDGIDLGVMVESEQALEERTARVES